MPVLIKRPDGSSWHSWAVAILSFVIFFLGWSFRGEGLHHLWHHFTSWSIKKSGGPTIDHVVYTDNTMTGRN
jgi:hypothetical protein